MQGQQGRSLEGGVVAVGWCAGGLVSWPSDRRKSKQEKTAFGHFSNESCSMGARPGPRESSTTEKALRMDQGEEGSRRLVLPQKHWGVIKGFVKG